MGCGVSFNLNLPDQPKTPPRIVTPQMPLRGRYIMSEFQGPNLTDLFEFEVLEETLSHQGYAFQKISPEIHYNYRRIKALGIFDFGGKSILVRLEQVTGQSNLDTEVNTILKFEDGAYTLGGDSQSEQYPIFLMSPK